MLQIINATQTLQHAENKFTWNNTGLIVTIAGEFKPCIGKEKNQENETQQSINVTT